VSSFRAYAFIIRHVKTELDVCIVLGVVDPFLGNTPKYAHAAIEGILRELFSMWSAPCALLGNGSLNTFTRNSRISIARQRRGKQALSTIQSVFRGVRAKWL
jgi:hypothetical protein